MFFIELEDFENYDKNRYIQGTAVTGHNYCSTFFFIKNSFVSFYQRIFCRMPF